MIDAMRSYLQVASGIVEAAAARAKDAAEALMTQSVESGSSDLGSQVTEIAEDLIEQSRTNRELLVGLIRTEIDRNIGRMGFVREEELAAVRKHVQRLERELTVRSEQASGIASAAVGTAASAGSAVRGAAAVAARKAGARPTTGAQVGGDQPTAGDATAQRPAAKKATAKRPAAKRPAAKKAARKAGG